MERDRCHLLGALGAAPPERSRAPQLPPPHGLHLLRSPREPEAAPIPIAAPPAAAVTPTPNPRHTHTHTHTHSKSPALQTAASSGTLEKVCLLRTQVGKLFLLGSRGDAEHGVPTRAYLELRPIAQPPEPRRGAAPAAPPACSRVQQGSCPRAAHARRRPCGSKRWGGAAAPQPAAGAAPAPPAATRSPPAPLAATSHGQARPPAAHSSRRKPEAATVPPAPPASPPGIRDARGPAGIGTARGHSGGGARAPWGPPLLGAAGGRSCARARQSSAKSHHTRDIIRPRSITIGCIILKAADALFIHEADVSLAHRFASCHSLRVYACKWLKVVVIQKLGENLPTTLFSSMLVHLGLTQTQVEKPLHPRGPCETELR
jgi:hypothetical protein